MQAQTIAIERCSVCDAVTHGAGKCPACIQHDLLVRTAIDLSKAVKRIHDCYAMRPHPAIAELQSMILSVTNRVAAAAGLKKTHDDNKYYRRRH